MVRIGQDAVEWARENAVDPPPGLGARDGTWHRMCLQFVRSAFGAPGGTANAGESWDNARHKVRVDSVKDIPAGYPVFYETADVEDHVAIKVGGLGSTLVRSTDTGPNNSAAVVDGDLLADRWNMRLLGYTKDINGVDIAQKDEPMPPRITLVKKTSRGKEVDLGLAHLRKAKAERGSDRRKKINAAIVAVKKIDFV